MSDEKYLEALRSYWKANQCLPSYAGICQIVGLRSKSAVFGMVSRLVEAGFVERVGGRLAPTRSFFARPLVASVRAGLPEPANDEGVEVINIDDYLVNDPNRTVLCKVRGDSMKDVGLLNGDTVVVESNTATRPNDIVVANVDGELTIKTLRLAETGNYYLEAANPAYPPIFPKGSMTIVGVVIGSFRRMQACPPSISLEAKGIHAQRRHALQEKGEAEGAAVDFCGEQLGVGVDTYRIQSTGQCLEVHIALS